MSILSHEIISDFSHENNIFSIRRYYGFKNEGDTFPRPSGLRKCRPGPLIVRGSYSRGFPERI